MMAMMMAMMVAMASLVTMDMSWEWTDAPCRAAPRLASDGTSWWYQTLALA